MCHIEPKGIDLLPNGSTEFVGSDDFNTSATCAGITALHRMSGLHSNAENDLRICQLTAYCAQANLQPDLSVVINNNAALASINGMCDGPQNWNRPCQPGELMVGYAGRADMSVSQLVIRCAPIEVGETVDGFTISTGPAYSLEGVGSMTDPEFGPHDCPQGSVATGAEARILGSFRGLKFLCHELALTYPP